MSNPKQGVVTALLDAADDHLHAVESARNTLARSASRVVSEFKQWQSALATMDSHTENAREAIAEARALRPHIRGGRRTDLGEAA